MQLPIFPSTTKMLSPTWGVFEKDNFVYYLHNGSPVHVHDKNDLNTYRYITANLISVSKKTTIFRKLFHFIIKNFGSFFCPYQFLDKI